MTSKNDSNRNSGPKSPLTWSLPPDHNSASPGELAKIPPLEPLSPLEDLKSPDGLKSPTSLKSTASLRSRAGSLKSSKVRPRRASLKQADSYWLRASATFDPAVDSYIAPLSHRTSISVADLPPVPKPAGELTSETQQPLWWLKVQATWWRGCMRLGMRIHDWAPPPPPGPSFHRQIETHTLNGGKSTPIDLAFYVPEDYHTKIKHGHRYPIVVNYHGGGFVMGSNLDDRYWLRVVIHNTPCIVVSVGYRRAPEHPFPTPVDDCVDTLLYLSTNATSLGIDPTRLFLSGFSAGANFTFAVPLRLKYHTSRFSRRGRSICVGNPSELSRFDSTKALLSSSHDLNILGIIAWYPLVDFATPRDHKRSISLKPEKTMPKFFTNLFDQSYLPDLSGINHSSPYVSPGRAPESMLQNGLPQNILLYLCEYDMLLREGQSFSKQLTKLGKNVTETLVKEKPHAWDKSPNPFRNQREIDQFYEHACQNICQILEAEDTKHLNKSRNISGGNRFRPGLDTLFSYQDPNHAPSQDGQPQPQSQHQPEGKLKVDAPTTIPEDAQPNDNDYDNNNDHDLSSTLTSSAMNGTSSFGYVGHGTSSANPNLNSGTGIGGRVNLDMEMGEFDLSKQTTTEDDTDMDEHHRPKSAL